MKNLNNYILEKLHINKDVKDPYNYHPKDKEELIECIKEKIDKEGLGTEDEPLNMNDIDTSEITDMSNLFNAIRYNSREVLNLSKKGYFNISDWDVSKVNNMAYMFYCSNFNGDISDWNVSNVENMKWMFAGSHFEGNISDWDVSKVNNMAYMFEGNPLQKNPPKWYKK